MGCSGRQCLLDCGHNRWDCLLCTVCSQFVQCWPRQATLRASLLTKLTACTAFALEPNVGSALFKGAQGLVGATIGAGLGIASQATAQGIVGSYNYYDNTASLVGSSAGQLTKLLASRTLLSSLSWWLCACAEPCLCTGRRYHSLHCCRDVLPHAASPPLPKVCPHVAHSYLHPRDCVYPR